LRANAVFIIIVVVVVDYGRRLHLFNLLLLHTRIPTLRIGPHFQCRWPGDHTQKS